MSTADTIAAAHPRPRSSFRRRPVSFGNPSLEAYQGIVYTSAKEEHIVIEGALPIPDDESWVALTDVPPEQVPEGVLHLVRSHRPWIKHLRVVIADKNETPAANAASLPKSSSIAESAASLLAASEETGEEQERNYIVLMELTTAESARLLVEDLDGQPFTSLDETQVGHLERKFELCCVCACLFFYSSTTSQLFVSMERYCRMGGSGKPTRSTFRRQPQSTGRTCIPQLSCLLGVHG